MSRQNYSCLEIAFNTDFKSHIQSILLITAYANPSTLYIYIYMWVALILVYLGN